MKFLIYRSGWALTFMLTLLGGWLTSSSPTFALPPPEDIPEEVLRTEIILEARSPVDGEPMSIAEYAELEADLQEIESNPRVSSEVRRTITLLRLRRTIRTFAPFLLK